VVEPLFRINCTAVAANSMCQIARWDKVGDLSPLAGISVRLHSDLASVRLYVLWLGPEETESSQECVAAGTGGPVQDTLRCRAAAQRVELSAPGA
jgi:hypothetical protein